MQDTTAAKQQVTSYKFIPIPLNNKNQLIAIFNTSEKSSAFNHEELTLTRD
jgi:hypothetical protein